MDGGIGSARRTGLPPRHGSSMSRRGAPITLEAGTVEVVGTGTAPVGPEGTEWLAAQRKWARGWRRTVFPGVFLVYLVQVVGATAHDSRGVAAVAGYAIVAGFAAATSSPSGRYGKRMPCGSGPFMRF